MRLRSRSVSSLLAASTMAALGHRAFGQFTAAPVLFPTFPYNATDDAPDNTTQSYSAFSIPSIQDPTVPMGNIAGAGAPYVVGTLSYKIQTGYGFSGSYYATYATSSNAFYYSPSTGIQFFGQYSPASSNQYQNTGQTYTYNASNPTVTSRYSSGGPVFNAYAHTGSLIAENASGQAIGYEPINDPNSTTSGVLGQHAYLYNISSGTYASLGLTTPGVSTSGASYALNYTYNNNANGASGTTTGTVASSISSDIDALGDVSGTSTRYFYWGGVAQTSSSSSSLGTSTYFYDSTTGQSVETGLYGNGYNYNKSFGTVGTTPGAGVGQYALQTDKGVNGGYSIGVATCYNTASGSTTSVGTQAWEYSKFTGQTVPIGMYANGATPNIAGFGTTNASGVAFTYTYNNSNSSLLSSTDRSSTVTGLNANGQVAGYDSYYAGNVSPSLGQVAWIYTPTTGSYRQAGLLTNGFASGGTSSFVSLTAQQSSTVTLLNKNGQGAGFATQYVSSAPGGLGNTGSGSVAFFQPTTGNAIQIGLTDAGHTSVTNGYSFTSNSPTELTDSGLVAGYAARVAPGTANPEGRDAWIYDSNTGQTYTLQPTAAEFATQYAGTGITQGPNSYFWASVAYLTNTGYAVGYWSADPSVLSGTNLSSPPSTEYGFLYSEATNTFTDISSDLVPQIGTGAFSSIGAIYNPFYVSDDGSTIYAGGGTNSGGVQTTSPTGLFVLTAVPEPASMTLATGLVAGGLLRRRRKIAR